MKHSSMKPTLVIGGGISGITTAVELAEVGREVILIEKESYLGGNVVKMNNYFPKLCPPACGLEINFRRIKQNRRITILTSTIPIEITGTDGDFQVKTITAPRYVRNTCTACGKCAEICPEEKPDAFNYGFTRQKIISLPHDMAFPMQYSLDAEKCKRELCNKCVEVCEYDAIDLSAKPRENNLEVGSVIIATGWKAYDAVKIQNLHYGDFENVVTNVELERLMASNGPGKGKLERPSDKRQPEEIAFVQCAGSRDENHLPYCSAVCCSASLKHALSIQEKYPDSKIRIFYIDLRVTGRNEDFLDRVRQNKNIELIKGKVAGIEETADGKNLMVEAENTLTGKKMKFRADLAVLATGIVPNGFLPQFEMNAGGFLTENLKAGLIPVSCCKKPMDVSSSVKDATAASLNAIQITD